MEVPSKAAKQAIRDYILTLDAIGFWQGYSFDEMSYSRWAANELLNCLDEDVSIPPLMVIGKFLDKLERYSRLNKKSSFIFSIAHEAVESIIDKLLS